jgi:hypothetical protein
MQRNCNFCGKPYEAKRASSKYCKDSCRVMTAQRGAKVTKLPTTKETPPETPPPSSSGLVAAVIAELTTAERLNTSIGQQAVLLAERIVGASFDTGASVASMHGRLSELMAKALEGVKVADDPLDEIARRRDAKRLSG